MAAGHEKHITRGLIGDLVGDVSHVFTTTTENDEPGVGIFGEPGKGWCGAPGEPLETQAVGTNPTSTHNGRGSGQQPLGFAPVGSDMNEGQPRTGLGGDRGRHRAGLFAQPIADTDHDVANQPARSIGSVGLGLTGRSAMLSGGCLGILGLEPDFEVGAVAERLVLGRPTPAKRDTVPRLELDPIASYDLHPTGDPIGAVLDG